MASPNMGLEIPSPLVTDDPIWAEDISESLEIIDEHDHSAGSGVAISPAGMNINADLPMNEHNLTEVRTTRYDDQASTPAALTDILIVYVKNGELCYRDADEQEVQLTLNGAINISGGVGVISGLVAPASASYSPILGTFIWLKDTDKPAKMVTSDIIMYEYDDAAAFPLTIKSAGLTAPMTLTLPNTPVSAGRALLALGSDDQLNPQLAAAASGVADINKLISVDNSAGTNYEATYLKNESVALYSLAYERLERRGFTDVPGGVNSRGLGSMSASSGTFTATSGSFVAVTNLTGTVAAKNIGSLFMGMLIPDENTSGNPSAVQCDAATAGEFRIVRDGATVMANYFISADDTFPPGSFQFVDRAADTSPHIYELQVRRTAGAGSISVTRCKLFIREL